MGTGDTLYIARRNRFYSYHPTNKSLRWLTPPPNPLGSNSFKTGTALAWDHHDSIYALCGAATGEKRRCFYCYSISSDSWHILANTTFDQGEGNSLAWVDSEKILYATIGGEQRPTHFMGYDPSSNTWNDLPADPPRGMGDGASLVWTGGDYLYALRGEYDENTALCDFWRYSLSRDIWTQMEEIPAIAHSGGDGGVGDGGSLLYVGHWLKNQTDYIYALSGNQAYPDGIPDNRTYRYTISRNSWERLPDLPFGVGEYVGCRLGYAQEGIYAWQGTSNTWEHGGDDLVYYPLPTPKDNFSAVEISILSPENKTYSKASIPLNLKVIESTSWIAYSLDDDRNQTIMGNTTLKELKEGSHQITVYANDSSGNMGCSSTIHFTIDVTPPQIKDINQVPEREVKPDQTVRVSANVTDNLTAIDHVDLSYTVNNDDWKHRDMSYNPTSHLYEAEISGQPSGTQIKYKITAYDQAENQKTADNTEQYYSYTVIPRFPLWLIPLLFLLLLIAMILLIVIMWSIKEGK
ncbi:MAG: hypothetical protein ACOC6G_04155 [Thermoproteota archaeon]